MFVENDKKVFTNETKKCIINKDYNPLNKDCKKICEREGLFMERKEQKILKKIQKNKHLKLKDKIIIMVFPRTIFKIYGIAEKEIFNNIYNL